MTTLILSHRKISSQLSLAAVRAAEMRYAAFLGHPVLAAVFAVCIAGGALVYLVMLLATFDLGVRLRDASTAVARQGEELKRMEVLEQEREAQFSVRHREQLERMEKIATLRYLTPKRTAVSEARAAVPSQ